MIDFKWVRSVNLALVFIAVALSILSVTESIYSERVASIRARGVTSYSTNWILKSEKSGDRRIDLPESIEPENSKVVIEREVDNAMAYYGGISFASEDQLVRVYVNNKKIYSLEEDRGNQLALIGGSVWNYINLRGKVNRGDILRIEYSNLDQIILDLKTENNLLERTTDFEMSMGRFLYAQRHLMKISQKVRVNDIYLASKQDMFGFIFINEAFPLALGAILATMGCVVTVFGFLPYRNEKRQGHLKYLGLSMFFMGFSVISENGVLRFAFYDVSRLDYIYGACKLLVGICFGIYLLQSNMVIHRKIIRAQIVILWILLGVKLFGFFSHQGLLLDTLISERGIIIIFALINLFLFLTEHDGKDHDHTLLLTAFFVLILFIAMSVIEDRTAIRVSSYFSTIGTTIFFFMLVLKELRYYSELYEQGKSVEYYKELAGRDSLTCIKNRTSFMEDLQEYQVQYQILSVVAFDVDNLKAVNDNLGHARGDELLQTIAAIIYRNFIDLGECYRMSGDEFICVLRNVSEDVIKDRLENSKVEMVVESQKRGFGISASYGVSHFDPRFDNKFEQIMKRADGNLYENKKRKRQSKYS